MYMKNHARIHSLSLTADQTDQSMKQYGSNRSVKVVLDDEEITIVGSKGEKQAGHHLCYDLYHQDEKLIYQATAASSAPDYLSVDFKTCQANVGFGHEDYQTAIQNEHTE